MAAKGARGPVKLVEKQDTPNHAQDGLALFSRLRGATAGPNAARGKNQWQTQCLRVGSLCGAPPGGGGLVFVLLLTHSASSALPGLSFPICTGADLMISKFPSCPDQMCRIYGPAGFEDFLWLRLNEVWE